MHNKVEYLGILPADTTFYSKRLRFPKKSTTPEKRIIRDAWVKEGYEKLIKCDIVFFDPDNGLQVKSVGKYSQSRNKFGIKYIFNDEVAGYYNRGQSLIIYQHRDRNPEVVYIDRIKNSINNIAGREDVRHIRQYLERN